jgi:hypothetical protein
MAPITVLLSTFNGQRLLPEQLDRIVVQTYRKWVLYFQDDGSSDDARSPLRNFIRDLGPARVVFGRAALDSQAWRQFWLRVRPAPSKYWLIRHYEVGLTQAMLRAGLVCKAAWPYEIGGSSVDKRGRLFNPTAHFWRELLEAGFPFIKRELLHRNPARVDITGWQTTASANATIDLSEITGEIPATCERTQRAHLAFGLRRLVETESKVMPRGVPPGEEGDLARWAVDGTRT